MKWWYAQFLTCTHHPYRKINDCTWWIIYITLSFCNISEQCKWQDALLLQWMGHGLRGKAGPRVQSRVTVEQALGSGLAPTLRPQASGNSALVRLMTSHHVLRYRAQVNCLKYWSGNRSRRILFYTIKFSNCRTRSIVRHLILEWDNFLL